MEVKIIKLQEKSILAIGFLLVCPSPLVCFVSPDSPGIHTQELPNLHLSFLTRSCWLWLLEVEKLALYHIANRRASCLILVILEFYIFKILFYVCVCACVCLHVCVCTMCP